MRLPGATVNGAEARPADTAQTRDRRGAALHAGAVLAAGLMAAGLLAPGCGSEPEAEPIPTTLPVLTTLRPQLTTTTIAPPPPQRRIYVVQPGDTLNKIANGFDVSVDALMEENGKQDTLLRIGEQLVIPPTVIGADSDQ